MICMIRKMALSTDFAAESRFVARDQSFPFGVHSNTVSEIWEAMEPLVDNIGHLRHSTHCQTLHPVPVTI